MFTDNLGQAPFDMLDHAGRALPLFSGISCCNSSNHPPDNNIAVECAVYSVSIVHISGIYYTFIHLCSNTVVDLVLQMKFFHHYYNLALILTALW